MQNYSGFHSESVIFRSPTMASEGGADGFPTDFVLHSESDYSGFHSFHSDSTRYSEFLQTSGYSGFHSESVIFRSLTCVDWCTVEATLLKKRPEAITSFSRIHPILCFYTLYTLSSALYTPFSLARLRFCHKSGRSGKLDPVFGWEVADYAVNSV